MGQKTNPIGLRVGIKKKWNLTWFNNNNFFKQFFLISFVWEKFLKDYLHFYKKISKTKLVLVLDIKFLKTFSRQLFIFVFFYRRRRFQIKNKKKKFRKKKFLWAKVKQKFKSLKKKI